MKVDMSRPANDEMVQGYRDGLCSDIQSAGENRSLSYRHGFLNGRADKTGQPRSDTCRDLRELANEVMDADERWPAL